MPLLSVVIVNFNYGRFLEAAIRSVLEQETHDIELIVIDGGSTDNSVEVIQKSAKGLSAGMRRDDSSVAHLHPSSSSITYWVSEKDKGQSDAFNKGFEKASGKYLTWLNADDVFVPGAVEAIVKQLKKHPECEWFTGNFYRFNSESRRVLEIGWGPHVYPNWMQRKNSPIVSFGPSTIFSKELWRRIGKLDVDMHLMMDTDLWMRFIVTGIKQRRINHFIWAFRMHEDSKTAEFGDHKLDNKRQEQFKRENQRAIEKSGYRCSRFWRYAVLFLRLVDGSLLRRFYYIMAWRST